MTLISNMLIFFIQGKCYWIWGNWPRRRCQARYHHSWSFSPTACERTKPKARRSPGHVADYPAMSFVFVSWLTKRYQNTNQLSWAINYWTWWWTIEHDPNKQTFLGVGRFIYLIWPTTLDLRSMFSNWYWVGCGNSWTSNWSNIWLTENYPFDHLLNTS